MERLRQHYRKPDEVLALHFLANPGAFPGQPRTDEKLLVRLLRHPAFEPIEVWALFQKQDSHCVRRVVWDPEETGGEGPAITASTAELESTVAEDVVNELSAMAIPTMPRQERFVIADGDCLAILIGDWQVTTEFCWPGDPPVGWEGLADWVDRLLAIFGAAFPEDSPKYSLPPEWLENYRQTTGQRKK